MTVELAENGRLVETQVAPRSAMNEYVRAAFIADCERVLARWNKQLADIGTGLRLPSRRFHRSQGTYAGLHFDPDGNPLSAEDFARRHDELLPSESDRRYVHSLQARPVVEPGDFASWIAPPLRGIHGHPIDFAYVRYNEE